MSDVALKLWTTHPSVFLVAKSNLNGKVLGCISYKLLNSSTVEMHRLSVDLHHRGKGIGRKLVQCLINTAKKNGYEMMYLETTNARFSAVKLYENMDFQYLRCVSFEDPIQKFTRLAIGGLKVVAFIYKL